MSDEKREPDVPRVPGNPVASQKGALAILQFTPPGFEHGEPDMAQVVAAARTISRRNTGVTAASFEHELLEDGLAQFLERIVRYTPPGHERSIAISRAREAGMWAARAIDVKGL